MSEEPLSQSPLTLPIDGVLDLHTFNPREINQLIHGRGIGNLQRTVHSILSKRRDVARYGFATARFGGIGATIVTLLPKASSAGA